MSDRERDLEFYRLMWRIRLFEQRVDVLFGEGALDGTTHLACGQEATAVGACGALREEDYVVSNHRGHGHLLARGGDPKRIMAELMGKADGYCAGRGGSQHLCVMSLGFLGTNGITGGGLPIAIGAAFAIRYRHEPRVVLCFFGDGASNQGTFHESLNMAAIWQLPVVFFCENNLYGMSTHVSRVVPVADIAQRAAAYAMRARVVDGMDVGEVYRTTLAAVECAREGGGPTLVEAKTYRYLGHSKSDRRVYRTREEEAEWADRDPLVRMKSALMQEGVSEQDLDAVREEEARGIEEAVAFARQSRFAPADSAGEGTYARDGQGPGAHG